MKVLVSAIALGILAAGAAYAGKGPKPTGGVDAQGSG